MIEALKPYPQYKDSSVDALGRVPKHWDVRKLGQIGRFMKGVGGSKEDAVALGVPCVRYGDLYTTHSFHIRKTRTFVSPRRATAYTPIAYGDVLFAASGETMEEIGKSAVNLMESDARCGGDVIVLRPNIRVHAPFLGYATDCASTVVQKGSMGRGSTVKHIYAEQLKRVAIALPSLDEQKAIARFLAWADRRLLAAISVKRRVIALVNERKHAVVERAVIRGIDVAASLKASGIPGVGNIPRHWATPLSQRIFRETIRPHAGRGEAPLSLSQRHGLIATKDLQERTLQTASYDNWKITIPGDLVLNRFKAHLGVFFASSLRGIVSFHYGVFAPRRKLCTKYFELLFHTSPYRAIFAGRSNGMTVGLQNLSNQNFYGVRCIVPPLAEQAAIVAHVDDQTRGLNAAIKRLESEIKLLREYRARLLSDVATGRLDVREVGARLPEDAEASGADTSESEASTDVEGLEEPAAA